jgi:phage FluMu protein Com
MRCPDCGNSLTELPMQGHAVHRCFRCGGFWVDSGTANAVTTDQLTQWRRIGSIVPMWGWGGKEVCPADGMKLIKYSGDIVPPSITVKRCDRCGKWWFPTDSLFAFKAATEARINYFQKWGMMTDARAMLLPVLMVLFMVAGTALGVRLVLQKQQTNIAAAVGISEMAVTYSGYGRGLAVFKADKPVTEVGYQMGGSLIWHKVPVEVIGGYNVANFKGLVEGGHYIINVLGKEYGFVAK